MPKHWREEGENAQPDFEARAWALGQVASAQAALALLEHRSRGDTLPWPEFAEYDCFACHHDLREPSWRQEPGHYANRLPGVFPWGTWYYPLLPQALRGPAGKDDAQVLNILGEIKKEMQKPSPNRRRVAEQTQRARTELAQYLAGVEKVHYGREALQRKYDSVRKDDQNIASANWDGAAQMYLALAALYNALGDMDSGHRDPALRDSLKGMAKRLEFPRGFDSPRDFEVPLSRDIRGNTSR
jgi:hypothetical protein